MPDALDVIVDPTTLERVVANLVGNALRYGEPPVVVTAEQSDNHVRICVEDHGAGISDDFVPYLFDYRAERHGARFELVIPAKPVTSS
ncbi:MAG: HAMP domain-containing histidine kinase [Acidobacteria bacterium]|nr:HAMP domain-containing histidine kinase [Acidobacteriota bacterium]